MNDYADQAFSILARIEAKINETCDNDPWFQEGLRRDAARRAAATKAESDRQAAVKAANPDAAAKVAARRAARKANFK